MPDFITVAKVDEIKPGTVRLIDIAGRRLALANANGTFYAVDGRCPHENISMVEAIVERETIFCPYHGSKFSLKTGAIEESPAVEPIGTYQVTLEGDVIKIAYPGT